MGIITYIIIGVLIGIGAGWLIKSQMPIQNDKDLEEKYNQLQNKNSVLENDAKRYETEINELRQKSDNSNETIIELNRKLASLEKENENWKNRFEEHQKEFEKNEKIMQDRFEVLANKILDEKTQKFTESNKTNLDTILKPFKEKISNFEKKVEETYKNESNERFSLKDQVKELVKLNTKLNEEAQNLTRALKGDTKKQGNWGELMLENILESSGLREGKEYEKQYSDYNDEHRRLQPDFVIYMPENKHLIIDSKVSLVAYERFVNAASQEERESAIRNHIISVKNHVNELADKGYSKLSGLNSPDFVLLFMPIESSFAAAIEADADLFNYAWDKKIVIVSPSTLLATLKTVASLWRLENQNKNAATIAREAGNLYDKFDLLLSDLIKLGSQLDTARKTYDSSFNKLKSGRGNLISRVNKLKNLGAKTSKDIDQNLIEEALENDEDFGEDKD